MSLATSGALDTRRLGYLDSASSSDAFPTKLVLFSDFFLLSTIFEAFEINLTRFRPYDSRAENVSPHVRQRYSPGHTSIQFAV